MAAEFRRIEKG
jgi:sRNA-binding protein